MAVALYFLLSGFILVYTYEEQIAGARNRKHFWEARFARIYPVYLFSLVPAYYFELRLNIKTQVAVLTMVQAWDQRPGGMRALVITLHGRCQSRLSFICAFPLFCRGC
jgi:peptidoglycan/LPS O-acetylase OafA/YrhL